MKNRTRAILEIEMHYDNIVQQVRFNKKLTASIIHDPLALAIWGGLKGSPWVAEVGGDRRFVRYKKDYSRSNSKGSQGVYAVYILDEGKVYEVNAWDERYFCTVHDWQVVHMDKSEVDKWLKDRSELMS